MEEGSQRPWRTLLPWASGLGMGLVAVLGIAALMRREAAAHPEAALPDGTVVVVEGITFGPHHELRFEPGFWTGLKLGLPAPWHRFTGPPLRPQRAETGETDDPAGGLWLSRWDPVAGKFLDLDLDYRVQTMTRGGLVFDVGGGTKFGQGERGGRFASGLVLDGRADTIRLRFSRGDWKAEVAMPNPRRGERFDTWEAAPLPRTNLVRGFQMVLHGLRKHAAEKEPLWDSLAFNMTAGLIQITDRPSALRQVEDHLNGLRQTVTRQVDIEARLYDVTLNDQFQFGVDWNQAIKMYGSAMTVGGAPTVPSSIGNVPIGADSFSMVFKNANTSVILKALQEQGEVRVISKPRLRTLNNQTALIKVGTEVPFFQRVANIIPASGTIAGTAAVANTDQVSIITVGTILAITPQISSDDWISLDISPVLTSLVESRLSPKGETIAPVIDIKQASTLIRVQDGATVVLGGLIQTSEARKQRRIPGASDIPLLGKLFTGRFDALQKRELVILLTPRIVK